MFSKIFLAYKVFEVYFEEKIKLKFFKKIWLLAFRKVW